MRKITKQQENPELSSWKRHNPGKHYKDLNAEIKRSIRKACLAEQRGLCAFCCCSVTVESAHNAHIQNQHGFPHFSLKWENIVASCCNNNHCGMYQNRKSLPLTPIMQECESEFVFYHSGRIKALSNRAQQTLYALNLGDDALKAKRKWAIRALTDSLGFHPIEDIDSWGTELVEAFIEECSKEVEGSLPPYSPVLVNIARQYLRAD